MSVNVLIIHQRNARNYLRQLQSYTSQISYFVSYCLTKYSQVYWISFKPTSFTSYYLSTRFNAGNVIILIVCASHTIKINNIDFIEKMNNIYNLFINIIYSEMEKHTQHKKKTGKFGTGQNTKKYVPGQIKVLNVEHGKKIRLNTFFGNTHTQNFCIRFNNDDDLIASGSIDGEIKVYNVFEGKTLVLGKTWKTLALPTTSIRWRPKIGQQNTNVFVTTNADGSLSWYNVAGQLLNRAHQQHGLLCCDYNKLSEYIAVGKDNFGIDLFDDKTHQKITGYEPGSMENDNGSHTNRVFSIKCLPDNSNVFISGGWDTKVRIWDVREKASVRNIYGAHISGDSLDYKDGKILTGSYRNQDIVQIWDYSSGKLIQNVSLDVKNHDAAYAFAAQYGKPKNNNLFAVGMSGVNQVQIYDNSDHNKIVGKIEMQAPCYTVDFANSSHSFSCSGVEGVVYIFTIDV